MVDINRQELCDEIAQMTGYPKTEISQFLASEEYLTQLHVKRGERVQRTGFGTWEQIQRAARIARNPRTGEQVKVKATKAPRFRAGSTFKAVVSGGKLERPAGLKALGARGGATTTRGAAARAGGVSSRTGRARSTPRSSSSTGTGRASRVSRAASAGGTARRRAPRS